MINRTNEQISQMGAQINNLEYNLYDEIGHLKSINIQTKSNRTSPLITLN